MAGLIAMIAVFLVVTIEMTFSTMNGGSMGGCHSGPGLPGYDPVAPGTATTPASAGMIPTILEEAPDGTVRGVRPTPRHRRSASIGTELQKIERGGMGMATEENEVWDKSESEDSEDDDSGDSPETRALNSHANGGRRRSGGGGGGGRPRSWSESSQRRAGRAGGSRLTEDQQQQKQLLQVMLLEAGILFHSVFIGGILQFLYTSVRGLYTGFIY